MIRSATPLDAQAIADIYNYYIENTVITFEETAVNANDFVERIDKVLLAGLPWLVGVDNDVVIGYAYATPWKPRSAYRFSVEISVYIKQKIVGGGWGSRLYQALFEQLKSKHIHAIIGGIALPNPASVALHEKYGMRKVAHFNEVGYKFGQWVDVGYWEKFENE